MNYGKIQPLAVLLVLALTLPPTFAKDDEDNGWNKTHELIPVSILASNSCNGFEAVVAKRVQGRAAIVVSFCPGRTLVEEVDATFEAIARWGRLLNRKLSVRSEMTSDMEVQLCLSESDSSPTEVSAT